MIRLFDRIIFNSLNIFTSDDCIESDTKQTKSVSSNALIASSGTQNSLNFYQNISRISLEGKISTN